MHRLRSVMCVALLTGIGCSSTLTPDQGSIRGNVNIVRADALSSSLVVGTFKSVVDSVAISVTGADGAPITMGQRFKENESSIPFSVTLPAGKATVSVQIVSNNKQTPLFSGSTSASIDRDGFAITVPITALRPALVVFPDTVTTVSTDGQTNSRFGSVTVHNSGKDSLAWSVARLPTGGGPNTIDPCTGGCTVSPASGKLAANADVKLTFRMPLSFPGVRIPAGSFTYTFTSPEGSVTLVWRYPAA